MSKGKPNERNVVLNVWRKDTAHLRHISGSDRDQLNNWLITQAIDAQWMPSGGLSQEDQERRAEAACHAMAGFAPADAVEGMMAAQAVALHGMMMECARKAQLASQPHEIAQGLRKSAISASRMFSEIVGALDRKRGKHRQQTVRVEKVMVAPGAQAVVGIANGGQGGRGHERETEGEPHAPPARLADNAAPGAVLPPLRRADEKRHGVPIARDAGEG
jgi:hypothetical protein